MRIIAGKKARSALIGPKDKKTRPITDRIKEALFSILGNTVVDAVVADLFCGTGSIGIEAISRGCAHAIMVDQDKDAFDRLKRNLENLDFASQATTIKTDSFRIGIPRGALPSVHRAVEAHYDCAVDSVNCDIVFLDPPFPDSREVDYKSPVGKLMLKLAKQIETGALVIIRHESKTQILETYGPLKRYDVRKYGISTISFYRKEDNE